MTFKLRVEKGGEETEGGGLSSRWPLWNFGQTKDNPRVDFRRAEGTSESQNIHGTGFVEKVGPVNCNDC